jgi:hypothetical protein
VSSVKASSHNGYSKNNLINKSGLINGSFHDSNYNNMWVTMPYDLGELTFDLGSICALTSINIWQYNSYLGTEYGVKDFDILKSIDGVDFEFVRSATLAKSPGGSIPPQIFDIDTEARYIKLKILSNHGDEGFTGLSEVQFSGTPAIEYQPPDTFGIETGNAFMYNEIRKGVSHDVELRIDQSTSASAPAGATHKQIAREDGILLESDYYETIPSVLKLWGFTDDIHIYQFKSGLVTAWYPMKKNDKRESSTKVINYGDKVSITVKVLAKEPLTLGFGTIEAFKLRFKIELSANGNNETVELYQWFVPYLGIVKYKDNQSLGELTDFSIAGGAITP